MITVRRVCLCCVILGISQGCGNDRYTLEKEYWPIGKQVQCILSNPVTVPPFESERVISLLSGFSRRHPGTDLSLHAEMEIARLYGATRNYAEAFRRLEDLFIRQQSPELKSEILFLRGTITETASGWEDAVGWYDRIMKEYPDTRQGRSIPLYIARHYRRSFQPGKMYDSYRQAIEHYRRRVRLNPGSREAFECYAFIYSCYSEMNSWEQALETLSLIVDEFEGKVPLDEVLLNMALIYGQELDDDITARKILEKLVREYPQSPLKQTAQSMLKS